MTKEEAIIRAGKIIADRSRWCQQACAVDKRGIKVDPCSTRAVAWDAIGVIYHVYRLKLDKFEGSSTRINEVAYVTSLLDRCASKRFRKSLNAVNDELGHAETLEVFRDGVRAMRAKPKDEQEAA